MNSPSVDEPLYRIGAVSRLTGIPTETIRMWERRYGVVQPNRSQGRNRLYTREDIGRLALLKRLVEAGHAISTVAPLTLEQLHDRLALQAPPATEKNKLGQCRVAVLGDVLPAQIAQHPVADDIEWVTVQRNPQDFADALVHCQPDALVLEYPSLHDEALLQVHDWLDKSQSKRAVVLYGFGTRRTLQRFRACERIVLRRAPMELPELQQVLTAALTVRPPASRLDETACSTPPRYSTEVLARVAAYSAQVQCECPRHLADLIVNLTAFERYSADCQHRHPEDAHLHHLLAMTTGRARELMEEALAWVAKAEGLSLDDDPS